MANFQPCNLAILGLFRHNDATFFRILPQIWLLWNMIDPWVGQLRVTKLAARICQLGLQGGSKIGQKLAKIL